MISRLNLQRRRHKSLLAAATSLHALFVLASSFTFILPSPSYCRTRVSAALVPFPSSPAFTTTPRRHLNIIGSELAATTAATSTDQETKTMTTSTSDNNEESIIQVPNIDSTTLDNLVEYTTSFSAANGLQVEASAVASTTENNKKKKKSYITAPISLLPQSYPASQFTHAQSLAAPFNELVDRISRDGQFFKDTLRDVRDVDVYTGKLLELYEEIYLGEFSCMIYCF